jgi:hypothetical protein
MNQQYVEGLLEHLKTFYCETQWDKVLEYFGEEAANDLDFMAHFDYEEIFARGDLKECEAFYHVCFMQRCLILGMFDLSKNEEAATTFAYLEYWVIKLHTKFTGSTEKDLWLH